MKKKILFTVALAFLLVIGFACGTTPAIKSTGPTVDDLKAQIQALQTKIDALQQQLSDVQTKLDQKTGEMQTIQAALDDTTKKLGAANDANTKLVQANGAIQGNLDATTQQLNSSNARNSQLELLVKDLQGKLDKLNADYQDMTNERDTLKKQIAALTADLGQKNNDLLKQIAQLTTDKNAMQTQIDKLTKDLDTANEAAKRDKEALTKTYDQLVADLKAEIADSQVQITQYQGMLTINLVDQLFFNSGDAEVQPKGFDVLKRVGNILKQQADKIIRIEGHTDDVPIGPYLQVKYPNNWVLGAMRAINVAVYFRDVLGIDPTRIVVVSFSKYRPLVPNTTPENQAKNRRIEIVLLDRNLYEILEMQQSGQTGGK